jgi:hypothetical protein
MQGFRLKAEGGGEKLEVRGGGKLEGGGWRGDVGGWKLEVSGRSLTANF